MTVGNDAGGQAEEGLVDVVAAFPADPQPLHPVQPGQRALDDPADAAQAGAMGLAAARDVRADALGPHGVAVDVVVVAAVGVHPGGASPGPAAATPYGWWDSVQQG